MIPWRRVSHSLFVALSFFLMLHAQDIALAAHADETVNCGYKNHILADSSCTPGLTNGAVTSDNILETICVQGYSKGVRPPVSVTNAIKKKVMVSYGNTINQTDADLEVNCNKRSTNKFVVKNGSSGKCYDISRCKPNSNNAKCYELDHLVSLELGGCPDCKENLWPEPYYPGPGAHEKDQVENYLHKQVCDGEMDLGEAQQIIRTDWYSCYKNLRKHKPCVNQN